MRDGYNGFLFRAPKIKIIKGQKMGFLDFLKEAACDIGMHSWSDWFYGQSDCTQIRQCVRPLCKKVNDEKRTLHTFGEWDYPIEGACRKIRTCSRCGYVVERTEHQWGEWEYKTEGDCSQLRKCLRCPDSETRIEHVLAVWRYEGPKSCNQISICERCGHKGIRTAIVTEDHDSWSAWGYDDALRHCGAQARYCLRCSKKEKRMVIAQHQYSDWKQISPSRRERRCLHCGRVEES